MIVVIPPVKTWKVPALQNYLQQRCVKEDLVQICQAGSAIQLRTDPVDMVWALALHVSQTRSGENSFSSQTWSRYWLWICHGHWLCMFSDKVWEKNSFSAQTWFGHGLALVLRHGLGKIVLSTHTFSGYRLCLMCSPTVRGSTRCSQQDLVNPSLCMQLYSCTGIGLWGSTRFHLVGGMTWYKKPCQETPSNHIKHNQSGPPGSSQKLASCMILK